LAITAGDFDLLIERDQHLLRFYGLCIACVVALGSLLAIVSFLVLELSSASTHIAQAGIGSIATLIIVPVREVLNRYERIRYVKMLRTKWQRLNQITPPPKRDLERLESIIWKLYGEERPDGTR
jgi:hypothetical protein